MLATSTIIAAAVAAAAGAAQIANTNSALNKQDRIAADGIRKQSKSREDVLARIMKTVEETRKSNPDDERKKMTGDYMETLRRNMVQAKTGLNSGGLSSEYDQAGAETGAQLSDYGTDIANLLGRMDSPIQQRQNEGNAYGLLGQDLSITGMNQQQDDFLNQLKMKSVRKNPWVDLLAGVAGGAAQGSLMGGAGGASGSAPAWTGSGYGSTWGTGNGLAAAGF